MSKQIIPTTSEGEYLRRHCSGIGLYPKQASKSTGTIKVNGTVGNSIAAGELLNREDGWQYAVLETVSAVCFSGIPGRRQKLLGSL